MIVLLFLVYWNISVNELQRNLKFISALGFVVGWNEVIQLILEIILTYELYWYLFYIFWKPCLTVGSKKLLNLHLQTFNFKKEQWYFYTHYTCRKDMIWQFREVFIFLKQSRFSFLIHKLFWHWHSKRWTKNPDSWVWFNTL